MDKVTVNGRQVDAYRAQTSSFVASALEVIRVNVSVVARGANPPLDASILEMLGDALDLKLTRKPGVEIGIKITNHWCGGYVIISAAVFSAAETAGARPGDVILTVNGVPINGLPLSSVLDMIAAGGTYAKGSMANLHLGVRRPRIQPPHPSHGPNTTQAAAAMQHQGHPQGQPQAQLQAQPQVQLQAQPQAITQQISVIVPQGVRPGGQFGVDTPSGRIQVTCPPNVASGGLLALNVLSMMVKVPTNVPLGSHFRVQTPAGVIQVASTVHGGQEMRIDYPVVQLAQQPVVQQPVVQQPDVQDPAARFCSGCGTAHSPSDVYCRTCGRAVDGAAVHPVEDTNLAAAIMASLTPTTQPVQERLPAPSSTAAGGEEAELNAAIAASLRDQAALDAQRRAISAAVDAAGVELEEPQFVERASGTQGVRPSGWLPPGWLDV